MADKKHRKTKVKEMHGAKNKERDEPGWLCRCSSCHALGYIEIGDTPPELCVDCDTGS